MAIADVDEKIRPIVLADRISVEINAPEDPALATLWKLALAKVEAAQGKPVVTVRQQNGKAISTSTKVEMTAVLDEYHRLMAKPHGSIADVIRERCVQVPGGD